MIGRNTIWWLAFWSASFVITQGMTLLRQQTGLNLSLVLMALSTGVAVGTAVGLLRGMEAVLSSPGGAVAAQVTAGPPSPALRPSSGEMPSRYCENCGSPVVAGSGFCEQCGHRLG